MAQSWSPSSWQKKEALQMPQYEDKERLQKAKEQLSSVPPLVFAEEVRRLKRQLIQVERGEAFILQGGDCAEAFEDNKADNIRDTFKLMLQMALTLTWGAKMPIVKIARMAGQYAKPRSSDYEDVNGQNLPSYRGDIINGFEGTGESRMPDPQRMVEAYYRSATTLNLLRAFSQGGLANLQKVHRWNLDFLTDSPVAERFEKITDQLDQTLSFMEACGMNPDNVQQMTETDYYVSHEALLLHYEEALTRMDSMEGQWLNTSAHMLWIGERTRQQDGAHMEYASGVINPIGLKVGPTLEGDELARLLDKLNPENEEGKIILITRMGEDILKERLPSLIEYLKKEGRKGIWTCDPMHANTFKSSSGFKTRSVDTILNEVKAFFDIHKACGTHAGGVHFEMTGQNVTECIGGAKEVRDEDLYSRYHTACDPRLNAAQSLELAFILSESLSKNQ